MTEEHRIPMSISIPCCGYCDKFHNGHELLPGRERICAKGHTVWMMSNMCGAYHQETKYQCPHQNKEVSSLECINNRMIPFPHCVACEVFLGEKGEPRMKPKKIIKRKTLLKNQSKPENKSGAVNIHDIAKGR